MSRLPFWAKLQAHCSHSYTIIKYIKRKSGVLLNQIINIVFKPIQLNGGHVFILYAL